MSDQRSKPGKTKGWLVKRPSSIASYFALLRDGGGWAWSPSGDAALVFGSLRQARNVARLHGAKVYRVVGTGIPRRQRARGSWY